ncbi:MAG: FKBP-type peptidyl-prolyl cis-trans isomerase [Woeseiaceae bacterium]
MTWLRLVAAGLLLSVAGCQPGGQSEDAQNSANDATNDSEIVGEAAEASYTMGMMVAQDVDEGFAGTLDEKAFVDGVAAHFAGQDAGDMEARVEEAMAYVQKIQQAAAMAEGAENLAAGEAFLAENGAREGVITTESGLQYEVITAGDGAMPTLSDTVTTHYHGTLIDGEVFDSSVDRGQPASFPVSGVISGWTEALQLMPVGSKWRLFVPADLAYGSQQRGPIKANSTLIFDVELLEIN